MPWIPLYLYENDSSALVDWLNNEQEIAFIVRVGESGRHHSWKAVGRVESLPDGKHLLWHVSGGPLPLPAADWRDPGDIIADPWAGWTERRAGAEPGVPWLGNPANVFSLDLHAGTPGKVGMSAFGWIGQRYRSLGNAALPSTERWWRRLRTWVRQNSILIPRYGALDGPDREIYTFPHAYQAIAEGRERAMNVG